MPKAPWLHPSKRKFCHYCHRPLLRKDRTRDHIIPRSLGGANADYNLVGSCAPCNRAKGDSYPTCPCNICQEAIFRFRSMTDEPIKKVR